MESITLTVHNLWIMICAILVFIMHLGFSLLEIGLTRQKNALNVLFKNLFVIAAGILIYALLGFNLMYPGFATDSLGVLGFSGFGIAMPANGNDVSYANGHYTWWSDFLFQAMFAATTATIVSGAVAERIKLGAFFVLTIIFVGLLYPIIGSWKWGGGFLDSIGFHDLAGSSLVHSVGGWAALITIFILGSRISKFDLKTGQSFVIMGHNIPLSGCGVLLLWFGWFGFNGGSVLSAEPGLTSLVLVNTCLGAATGAIAAMLTSYAIDKNFDITMTMNGILAGLVSITAGADVINPMDAVIIGLIGGVIVVLGVIALDKCRLDDPVGAVSVHLFCGIWGTLAVGLFGALASFQQLWIQLQGIVIIAISCIIFCYAVVKTIQKCFGIRVSAEEELMGLDRAEHQIRAYPDFRCNQH